MRTIAFPAALGLLAVGLLAVAQPAEASNRETPTAKHWSNASSKPWVTFVDKTSTKWPVHAATLEWASSSTSFDVIYRSGTCGGWGHCVTVDELTPIWACVELAGQTVPDTSGGHYTSDTYVWLNTQCESSPNGQRERRAAACHEQGHAIGVAHASVSPGSTCMVSHSQLTGLHEKPRAHDFHMINSVIYGHRH